MGISYIFTDVKMNNKIDVSKIKPILSFVPSVYLGTC